VLLTICLMTLAIFLYFRVPKPSKAFESPRKPPTKDPEVPLSPQNWRAAVDEVLKATSLVLPSTASLENIELELKSPLMSKLSPSSVADHHAEASTPDETLALARRALHTLNALHDCAHKLESSLGTRAIQADLVNRLVSEAWKIYRSIQPLIQTYDGYKFQVRHQSITQIDSTEASILQLRAALIDAVSKRQNLSAQESPQIASFSTKRITIEDKLRNLKLEMAATQGELDRLNSQKSTLTTGRTTQQAEIEKLSGGTSELQSMLTQLRQEVENIESQIATTQQSTATFSHKLQDVQTQLDEIERFATIRSKVADVGMILTSKSQELETMKQNIHVSQVEDEELRTSEKCSSQMQTVSEYARQLVELQAQLTDIDRDLDGLYAAQASLEARKRTIIATISQLESTIQTQEQARDAQIQALVPLMLKLKNAHKAAEEQIARFHGVENRAIHEHRVLKAADVDIENLSSQLRELLSVQPDI